MYGYSPYETTIDIQNNIQKTITLETYSLSNKSCAGQQHKSKEDLTDAAPSNMLSFSNSDLFSQIRILPGVSLATANTGYNVAGGGTDEKS